MTMNNLNKNTPVAINKCTSYDSDKIFRLIKSQFENLIADRQFFENKNVVIKPNLLMKASPEQSITTHPVCMTEVINVIKSYSPKSITIAESPGGPYTSTALKIIYKSTGMISVSDKTGVPLNYDTSSQNIPYSDGCVCKVFDIISPIANADIIVNVCKLKTHALTTMSASVKNLFGTIPGIEKFEMHTRFKDLPIFEKMLTDLCAMHCKRVPVLSVVDAVKGMEGNGPSGGDVRDYGLIFSSLNPFNLDIACSSILGVEGEIGYIENGKEQNFCAKDSSELKIYGEDINGCKISDLKLPETKSLPILKKLPKLMGGRINKFFEPRPEIIKNKCIGCGECMRSCPAKTIQLKQIKNNKKIAKINPDNCIKCYCCQELCPIKAVKIKKNPIFRILK